MSAAPLGRDGFAAAAPGVSRETLDRLATYLTLLEKWNRRINLVGASTLADPWRRHILDSWGLWPHLPAEARTLVDLGSGAGLPGLVLAILGRPGVTLIEADQRKAVFLREAARATGAAVRVVAERIEAAAPEGADLATARACAPLAKLLEYAHRHLCPDGVALVLKGQNVESEIAEATRYWGFGIERLPTPADPSGVILRLRSIVRA